MSFLGNSSFNLIDAMNYAIDCVFLFALAARKSDVHLGLTFGYLDKT